MAVPPQLQTLDGKSIKHHNADLYAEARAHFGVPDDFLSDFKFASLRASGGKGGDLLAFVGEDYIVKQVTGSDQELLEKRAFVASHVEHVTGRSLIARVLLHFYVPQDGTPFSGFDYFVQSNWLPRRKNAKYAQVYDLKGSMDDKTLVRNGRKIPEIHKRCWHVNKWSKCCWKPDRHDYYAGKQHAYNAFFHIPAAAKAEVMEQIEKDAKWFMEKGLMDYSLVVGVIEGRAGQTKEEFPAGAPGSNQPWIFHCGGVTIAYYMGIIDYLQEWTGGKKVAMMIKRPIAPQPQSTVPPIPYGERFISFFAKKWAEDEGDTTSPMDTRTSSQPGFQIAGAVDNAPSTPQRP